MSEKVRLGVIGCGGIARHHLRQAQQIPDMEIVAITEPSEAQRARTFESFPHLKETPLYHDHRQMLDQVALDGVLIATPHTLHFQQVMDALDHNLHVLVEKPMVCTVDHAKTLVRRFEESGKIGSVSYQRHYSSMFRYMYDGIRNGQIGEVQYVTALQCQGWYRGTKGSWRQDPALSGGGQLNDSGSHLVDIILWVTGLRARLVSAWIENFDAPVDINSTLAVKFAEGALGNLSVIGNSTVGWHEDITITGSEGTYFCRNGHFEYCDAKGNRSTPEFTSPDSSPLQNFVNAIHGKEMVQTPPICGLRVIELTEAAWQSAAQNGQPVEVKISEV